MGKVLPFIWIVFFSTWPWLRAETLAPPTLKADQAQTQDLVSWAEKVVQQTQQNLAHSPLSAFQKVLQHLNQIPPEISRSNFQFEADVQRIRHLYWKTIYYWGSQQIKTQVDSSKTKKMLDLLVQEKAHQEYQLPFLKSLESWEKYYDILNRKLKVRESFPDRLHTSLPIPPEFHIKENFRIKTLFNLIEIVDRCKKAGWTPTAEEELRILQQLSRRFEAHRRYNYAITSLQMIQKKLKTPSIQKELLRLQRLQQQEDDEELY